MIKLYLFFFAFLVFLLPAVSFSQDSVQCDISPVKTESLFPFFSGFSSVLDSDIILKDTSYKDLKVFKNRSTSFRKKRNFLAVGLTGSAALLGTYAAFRFNELSNESYINFQETGEQSLYDKSKQYDVYFYISLALSQIAFSAFIYFLFFD